jgi:cytochrome c oxidase accessory protein FixG
MCIVTCPYGRLQSVLLDKQSSIVGYDTKRGEPRGKPKKHLPVVKEHGDCVDCAACVAVCPTGIDIRDGLQMECIGCAQCIDACDTVMDGLHRDRGLIRYTSKAELAGEPQHRWRPRTIIYPALLALAVGAFTWSIARRTGTEVWVKRISGPSFVELPDGNISAQARIKLENGHDETHRYALSLVDAPDATLRSQALVEVHPRKAIEQPVFVDVPRASFVDGKRRVRLRIDDSKGFERVVELILIGPEGATQ